MDSIKGKCLIVQDDYKGQYYWREKFIFKQEKATKTR